MPPQTERLSGKRCAAGFGSRDPDPRPALRSDLGYWISARWPQGQEDWVAGALRPAEAPKRTLRQRVPRAAGFATRLSSTLRLRPEGSSSKSARALRRKIRYVVAKRLSGARPKARHWRAKAPASGTREENARAISVSPRSSDSRRGGGSRVAVGATGGRFRDSTVFDAEAQTRRELVEVRLRSSTSIRDAVARQRSGPQRARHWRAKAPANGTRRWSVVPPVVPKRSEANPLTPGPSPARGEGGREHGMWDAFGSQACATLRPGLSDLGPLGLNSRRTSVAGALRPAEAPEFSALFSERSRFFAGCHGRPASPPVLFVPDRKEQAFASTRCRDVVVTRL